jgi:hypothetical protein
VSSSRPNAAMAAVTSERSPAPLNLPGSPPGAAYSADAIGAAIPLGIARRSREPGIKYFGVVDMAGGSSNDAVVAISHWDPATERAVLSNPAAFTCCRGAGWSSEPSPG